MLVRPRYRRFIPGESFRRRIHLAARSHAPAERIASSASRDRRVLRLAKETGPVEFPALKGCGRLRVNIVYERPIDPRPRVFTATQPEQ